MSLSRWNSQDGVNYVANYNLYASSKMLGQWDQKHAQASIAAIRDRN